MTNVATIRYDEDSQRYGDGGIKKCATSSQVLAQIPFMISFGSNTSCCLDRTGLQCGTTYEEGGPDHPRRKLSKSGLFAIIGRPVRGSMYT